MKPLRLFAAVLFTICMALTFSYGQEGNANRDIRDRFTGAWRLAWLEEQSADGKVHKADCSGLLIYTPDGHMSVQVMYRNSAATSADASSPYTQGGYEASFGRYEVNDAHTFTFHVDGALVGKLIGKDLKRIYEISGTQLIVRSSDPNEHWRVAWEHY